MLFELVAKVYRPVQISDSFRCRKTYTVAASKGVTCMERNHEQIAMCLFFIATSSGSSDISDLSPDSHDTIHHHHRHHHQVVYRICFTRSVSARLWLWLNLVLSSSFPRSVPCPFNANANANDAVLSNKMSPFTLAFRMMCSCQPIVNTVVAAPILSFSKRTARRRLTCLFSHHHPHSHLYSSVQNAESPI
jgi:hypothetical protein